MSGPTSRRAGDNAAGLAATRRPLWPARLHQFVRDWAVVVLLGTVAMLRLANVHWTTDVPDGWCAGLLAAVLSAALYDRYHRRRVTGRETHDRLVSPPTWTIPS